MKRLTLGLLLSLSMSAPLFAAKKDVATQVIIRCECLRFYPAWLCESFWWALC